MSRELGLKIVEAVLFSRADPVDPPILQALLPDDLDAADLLAELEGFYRGRGIRLERIGAGFALRTDPEVAPYLSRIQEKRRKPTKAALEVLATIAWKQPVTKAEIEQVRGVGLAQGSFEQLVDAGWIAPAGRRDLPGRPMTWATTSAFLDAFGLASIDDLPRQDDLDSPELIVLADGGPDEATTAQAGGPDDFWPSPPLSGS